MESPVKLKNPLKYENVNDNDGNSSSSRNRNKIARPMGDHLNRERNNNSNNSSENKKYNVSRSSTKGDVENDELDELLGEHHELIITSEGEETNLNIVMMEAKKPTIGPSSSSSVTMNLDDNSNRSDGLRNYKRDSHSKNSNNKNENQYQYLLVPDDLDSKFDTVSDVNIDQSSDGNRHQPKSLALPSIVLAGYYKAETTIDDSMSTLKLPKIQDNNVSNNKENVSFITPPTTPHQQHRSHFASKYFAKNTPPREKVNPGARDHSLSRRENGVILHLLSLSMCLTIQNEKEKGQVGATLEQVFRDISVQFPLLDITYHNAQLLINYHIQNQNIVAIDNNSNNNNNNNNRNNNNNNKIGGTRMYDVTDAGLIDYAKNKENIKQYENDLERLVSRYNKENCLSASVTDVQFLLSVISVNGVNCRNLVIAGSKCEWRFQLIDLILDCLACSLIDVELNLSRMNCEKYLVNKAGALLVNDKMNINSALKMIESLNRNENEKQDDMVHNVLRIKRRVICPIGWKEIESGQNSMRMTPITNSKYLVLVIKNRNVPAGAVASTIKVLQGLDSKIKELRENSKQEVRDIVHEIGCDTIEHEKENTAANQLLMLCESKYSPRVPLCVVNTQNSQFIQYVKLQGLNSVQLFEQCMQYVFVLVWFFPELFAFLMTFHYLLHYWC